MVLQNLEALSVEKILKELDAVKVSEIDWISVKFLKNRALVIAIHWANIIDLLIKLAATFLKCMISNIKPLFIKKLRMKLNFPSAAFDDEGDKKINLWTNTVLSSKKYTIAYLPIRL